MLTRRHFRLQTFGRLTLSSVVGETVNVEEVRPRHLAVLAVLAFSRKPVARGRLVAMFWGDESEARARHSLSNALSALRAILGADAITARHDDVGLSDDLRVELDVVQFTGACDAHDDKRAGAIYTGPFLEGVYVPGAPEFDRWASGERIRLERKFLEVCERLAPSLIREVLWMEAADLARRWLEAAPDSPAAFTTLLRAQAGSGTPAALRSAIDEYERTKKNLAQSHGVKPAAAVQTLVAQLRDQLAVADQTLSNKMTPPSKAPAMTTPAAGAGASGITESTYADFPPPVAHSFAPPRWWQAFARNAGQIARFGTPVVSLLLVGGLLLTIFAARRRPAAIAVPAPQVIAVTSIDDVRGDSSLAWLRAGLPRMIASDLSAGGAVDVVAPSRVRDVVVRLNGSALARLSEEQSIDIARRVGATWVVTGGVSTANGGYLLDVTARSVETPSEFQSFTVFAATPIELGGLAASRLASLLGDLPGPTEAANTVRFSGIETSNVDAYRHYIRGAVAMQGDQIDDAARELDAAILLDSGFATAVRARLGVAEFLEDTAAVRKLAALAKRDENRLPGLERLVDEINGADSSGETARAEALSARLVQQYPRDPRAHTKHAELLMHHAHWAAAESALVTELALDSLAMSAGRGPCTPCEVFWRLSQTRLAEGDAVGAAAAAGQWISLQPDLPGAWRNLSATLAATGRSSESVNAGYHMLALNHDAPWAVDFGRTMLSARRYDIVDSLLKSWRGTKDPVLTWGARDLRVMLERERGQFAASIQSTGDLPATSGLILVRADGLARLGRLSEARRIYERSGHPVSAGRSGQFTPPEARGYAWGHALEADALIRAGDTTAGRALLDSIQRVAVQSYYDRDKRLHHHVRGMLYFAEGKFADAERKLRAAEWGANGWTRTNIELARAQLAEGHASDAVQTLRDAYMAPLDAMGRYVPRSEMDFWMSRAFAAAGQRDSAERYAKFVRTAWAHADPMVKRELPILESVSKAGSLKD